VELRCDPEVQQILARAAVTDARIVAMGDDDYDTEYMALIATMHIVADIDAAIAHIGEHGGGTEVIISEDPAAIHRFVHHVDATAVMVNASTRFNDGGQLGLGANRSRLALKNCTSVANGSTRTNHLQMGSARYRSNPGLSAHAVNGIGVAE
jgi:gamma-glutamyl phosphate reductase